MGQSLRAASKIEWVSTSESLTLEQINTGSLLRIADSLEKVAIRHTELMRERDYWERECRAAREDRDALRRSNASLRGHMKRVKAKKEQEHDE
ncbi:MAG: hypothetical protein WA154_10975 [Moraxellaceae bacterium]